MSVMRIALSPAEAKTIAADAYLYAYPMLYNYKTLFQQAVDPSFPAETVFDSFAPQLDLSFAAAICRLPNAEPDEARCLRKRPGIVS